MKLSIRGFRRTARCAFVLIAAQALVPGALAQNAPIQVAWTSDYTTVPPVQTCSASGPVAGPTCKVHVHLPEAAIIYMVAAATVTEDAGGVHNVGPVALPGSPQPGPCPPGCTQSPYTTHFDYLLWNTTACHNRPHRIAVSGVYYDMMMRARPFVGQTDVDVANLTIAAFSPENPDPILWNGNPQQPVDLRAYAAAAYTANVQVTLKVYASDQALVKTQTWSQVVGPAPTLLSYPWNGSQNAQGSGTAPSGAYLFRWELMAASQMDTDCDKSAMQTLPTADAAWPPLAARYANRVENGPYLDFDTRYRLQNAVGTPASAGNVRLVSPHLTVTAVRDLTASELALGEHSGQALVAVRIAESLASSLGSYDLLVSTLDGNAAQDRAHRQRWSLQLANRFAYRPACVTAPSPFMQFRGKSEGTSQPCPVVVKGTVTAAWGVVPPPVLKYRWEQRAVDAQEVESVIVPEADVPAGQLADLHLDYDAAAGLHRFRATWNHDLDRCLVLNDQGQVQFERYVVRVYAVCNGDQAPQEQAFRVLSFAKPVAGAMLPGRDWLATGGAGGPWPTTGYNTARDRSLTVTTTGDAPHLGIDYAGAFGSNINAAEWGTVEQGPFPHQDRWSGIQPTSKVDEALAGIDTWTAQHPGQTLVVTYETDSWDNQYNLGPHRRVLHGPANIALKSASGQTPEDTYDQGTVRSAYGHVKEPMLDPPAPGAVVDISQSIAQVGRWVETDPFGLGDFRGEDGKLIFKWNGVEQFQVTGITRIVWPSTSSTTHLHFEARIEEQEGLVHLMGQVNPHDWLKIGYGLRK